MARCFRTSVVWMGKSLETLADVACRPGGVLLVGINPSPVSVAAGHYYQGNLGKRLWSRLMRLGLVADTVPGAEDEAFAGAGHGLTDVVKRPTSSADEITIEEMRFGAEGVREKVRAWKPGLILFPFKKATRALLGTPALGPGRGPSFESVPTFLLSGPYAARAEAERVDAELSRLLGLASSPIEVDPRSREAETTRLPSGPVPACHVATGLDMEPSQRITAKDIEHGQIRFPHGAKRFFPQFKDDAKVVLRGESMQCGYDPKFGPDRERSAVLRVGRSVLSRLVKAEETLKVSRGANGVVCLD